MDSSSLEMLSLGLGSGEGAGDMQASGAAKPVSKACGLQSLYKWKSSRELVIIGIQIFRVHFRDSVVWVGSRNLLLSHSMYTCAHDMRRHIRSQAAVCIANSLETLRHTICTGTGTHPRHVHTPGPGVTAGPAPSIQSRMAWRLAGWAPAPGSSPCSPPCPLPPAGPF